MKNTVAAKEILDSLYLNEKQLTSGQLSFIQGCKKQFTKTKELSDKQVQILIEIKKSLPDHEVRFSGSVAVDWKH